MKLFVIAATLCWLANCSGLIMSQKKYGRQMRIKRAAGTDPMCVPRGTCLGVGSRGPVINPRIVTEGSGKSEEQQILICKTGEEECLGDKDKVACGVRHVDKFSIEDGPSDFGAHPWQAYIRNETEYTGSGVLLDENHVLTAAHKVDGNRETLEKIEVYIGVHNELESAQKRSVQSIDIHEKYNRTTLINDIAILKLDKPIALGYQSNIATACVPEAEASFTDKRCIVAGWGETAFEANDAPTTPQKQVTVPIVDFEKCKESMARPNLLGSAVDEYLDENELCAGGEINKDACTRDGGAPLMCEDDGKLSVVGLVIWGKKCGMADVYGVYVNVAKYAGWIAEAIDRLKA